MRGLFERADQNPILSWEPMTSWFERATNHLLLRSLSCLYPGVCSMKFASIAWALPLFTTVGACATASNEPASLAEAPVAHAKLLAGDATARGEAKVTQAADGLHVFVRAEGLTPGLHAVHLHTTGVCTAPDFASAGGHWNPTGRQHGKDNPQGMHMGDMPNMLAGADGTGEMEYVIPGGLVSSGAAPLLDADGAAVVIHAQADDNKTDPAGNAGGRVACGVLTAG
jgi:Cu-Zn family superoxide dismutase